MCSYKPSTIGIERIYVWLWNPFTANPFLKSMSQAGALPNFQKSPDMPLVDVCWRIRLSKWVCLISQGSRTCTNQVPWENPVLLLDSSSQSNTHSKSTAISSVHIKRFYHLMIKGKAIPTTPPPRSSAVALSRIPGACLPWGHTTQNARKEEIT